MAKRFIETAIWESPEFAYKPIKVKLLTLFIISRCDAVGVFEMAPFLISAYIGEDCSHEDIMSIPLNIEEIEEGKYWLVNFCDFQYGELRESCKPHRKYIEMLRKLRFFERVSKGYRKGINTLQEKEKEKEKEKEEEKECANTVYSFDEFWSDYDHKKDRERCMKKWKSINEKTRELIKEHVPVYIAATEKRFRKYPATYLNNKTWLDEELPTVNNDKDDRKWIDCG